MFLSSVLQQIIHSVIIARADIAMKSDAAMSFHMTRVISFSNIQGVAIERRLAPRNLTLTEEQHLI